MIRKLTCHCGAVELAVELSDDEIAEAFRCDCSFCSRRGALVAPVPGSALRIVRGAGALSSYKWGTGAAEHFFCATCGIYTHHRRRVDPSGFGVNVAAIEGVDVRKLRGGWSDGRSLKLP